METKIVKVVRSTTIERTESILITVARRDGEFSSFGTLAEKYVEAAVRAGQSIPWSLISDEMKTYPSPSIDAEPEEVVAAPPPVARPEPHESDVLEPL